VTDSSTPPVPPGDVSADAVAEAALGCPCVLSLATEGPGVLATYLPGRRVVGVSLREDACEVGVVLLLEGRPLPQLAEQVRRAVAPVAGGRPVHVTITDVVLPDDDAGDPYPDEARA